MQDDLAKIVRELAAHSIKVSPDGVVVIYSSGEGSKFQLGEAVKHVRAKADENAHYLLKLWQEAADLCEDRGRFPSNDVTRRLFISAVKHLCKLSMDSGVLKRGGVYETFKNACRSDDTQFSNHTMSQLVDYRLAIDWVSHLVAYDDYRAELLEVYAAVKDRGTEKTAAGLSRNYDTPEERLIPWWDYKDRLVGQGSERDAREQDRQRVKDDAVKDEGEKGTILDEFDEIAHGVNFKKRMRGTILDMREKLQIDRDPRGAQEGARLWGSQDVNPHERTLLH